MPATSTPSTKSRYAKAQRSVVRSQASETLDGVDPVMRRFPGAVGGVTSGAVVPVTGALMADTLPAASIACTRYVWVQLGTSHENVLVVLFPGW